MSGQTTVAKGGFLWGKHLARGERITVKVKRIRAPYGDTSKWDTRGGAKYPMLLEAHTALPNGCECIALTESATDRIKQAGVDFRAADGAHIEFARNRSNPDWALVVVNVTPPVQQRRLF